jgi:hypothetical protein
MSNCSFCEELLFKIDMLKYQIEENNSLIDYHKYRYINMVMANCYPEAVKIISNEKIKMIEKFQELEKEYKEAHLDIA